MGVFHVFKIVQMVPNRAKHQNYFILKKINKIMHLANAVFVTAHKNSFPLRISSVNVTKIAVF